MLVLSQSIKIQINIKIKIKIMQPNINDKPILIV